MLNPNEAREILGLTQKQMKKICNASLDTVKSWDQGRRTPQGPSARLLEIAVDLKRLGLFEKIFSKYLK